jgi:hypothetical protein
MAILILFLTLSRAAKPSCRADGFFRPCGGVLFSILQFGKAL